MVGCQFIGADQDPLKHWPIKYCGAKTVEGKSYCHDHYWRVYQKGTAVAGKKKERAIEQEIAELKKQQEIDEDEAYESV
jgi:hypothetical protein